MPDVRRRGNNNKRSVYAFRQGDKTGFVS